LGWGRGRASDPSGVPDSGDARPGKDPWGGGGTLPLEHLGGYETPDRNGGGGSVGGGGGGSSGSGGGGSVGVGIVKCHRDEADKLRSAIALLTVRRSIHQYSQINQTTQPSAGKSPKT
jgi:hypothetical protein